MSSGSFANRWNDSTRGSFLSFRDVIDLELSVVPASVEMVKALISGRDSTSSPTTIRSIQICL